MYKECIVRWGTPAGNRKKRIFPDKESEGAATIPNRADFQ